MKCSIGSVSVHVVGMLEKTEMRCFHTAILRGNKMLQWSVHSIDVLRWWRDGT